MSAASLRVSAKGCHACKFLKWHDDDTDGMPGPNSGWACGKRAPADPRVEKALVASMQLAAYRFRYKRCFEAKVIPVAKSIEADIRAAAVQPPVFDKDPTNVQF